MNTKICGMPFSVYKDWNEVRFLMTGGAMRTLVEVLKRQKLRLVWEGEEEIVEVLNRPELAELVNMVATVLMQHFVHEFKDNFSLFTDDEDVSFGFEVEEGSRTQIEMPTEKEGFGLYR